MKKRERPGQPPKKIDWEQCQKLTELGLSAEEVASVLKVSYYHLLKLIKDKYNMTWREYQSMYRANAKSKILSKQYELARKGNVQMLIWLGKNWCGQTDKQAVDVDINVSMMSTEEIVDKIVSTIAKYPELENQILAKLPYEGGNGNTIEITAEASCVGQGDSGEHS